MALRCTRRGMLQALHLNWVDVQPLGGGFILVAMEFLGGPWKPFLELSEAEMEGVFVVLEALIRVHALTVFDHPNSGSVHGDVRGANIMVMHERGVLKVKFIDFDWAGQEFVSTYPPNMNHTSITWPNGVESGKPMLQVHDNQVVQLFSNLSAH